MLPKWLSGNESTCQTGDTGSTPGSGISPGEENGNPFQYSCLGNPGIAKPGGLQFMGVRKNIGHNLATKQQQQENYASSKRNHFRLSDFSPHRPWVILQLCKMYITDKDANSVLLDFMDFPTLGKKETSFALTCLFVSINLYKSFCFTDSLLTSYNICLVPSLNVLNKIFNTYSFLYHVEESWSYFFLIIF